MGNAATKTVHPDFIGFAPHRDLTAEQVAWLNRHEIKVCDGARYGRYFYREERWIEPIRATDTEVSLYAVDRDQNSDGARLIATFPRLRDALRALAKI